MNKSLAPVDGVVQVTWISVGAAIALLLLGGIAALAPLAVGIAIGILVVWVVVFSGLAHLVHAWDARGGMFFWRLMVGTIYVLSGLYLLMDPIFDLPALTRFIGMMFTLEAVLLLAGAWWLRDRQGSGWMALDAGLTLLIAASTLAMWPWATAWILGLFIGFNIMFSGIAFLAMFRGSGGRPRGASI